MLRPKQEGHLYPSILQQRRWKGLKSHRQKKDYTRCLPGTEPPCADALQQLWLSAMDLSGVRSQGRACGPYPFLLKYCLLGSEGRTIIVYSCVPMSAHQAPKDVPNPWPYRRSCLNLVSLETVTVINVGRFVRSKRGGKESTRGGEEVTEIKMYFTHASNCQK